MAYSISIDRRPARKPGRSQTLARALGTLWLWRRRMESRAELRHILDRADDRMLADVGLTRAKVADEAGKHFWQA